MLVDEVHGTAVDLGVGAGRLEPEDAAQALDDGDVAGEAVERSHVAGGTLQKEARGAGGRLEHRFGDAGIVGAVQPVVGAEGSGVASVAEYRTIRGSVEFVESPDQHIGVADARVVAADHHPL